MSIAIRRAEFGTRSQKTVDEFTRAAFLIEGDDSLNSLHILWGLWNQESASLPLGLGPGFRPRLTLFPESPACFESAYSEPNSFSEPCLT